MTLYENKNNIYTFTNETICLRSMIIDLRPKLREWIKKFLGDNCSYFKRMSLKLHLWLIYSTFRPFDITQHCLEAQIALIVALVDAYNCEKQWLQKQQNVSLSLTTYVFKSQILDLGTKFCTQLCIKTQLSNNNYKQLSLRCNNKNTSFDNKDLYTMANKLTPKFDKKAILLCLDWLTDIFPADWIQSERLNSVCPCHFVYDIFFVSVCTRFLTYARREKATAPPIFWSTKHHRHKKLLSIKDLIVEFSFSAHRCACQHRNCSWGRKRWCGCC